MAMRDFFRGDRDRNRWRDENRYGQQDDQRYAQSSRGREFSEDRDREWSRGRDGDQYESYAAGEDGPQIYGQSGRGDWPENEFRRNREYQSQGGQRGWDGQRDWNESGFEGRFRRNEQRGYGGYGSGGGYSGSSYMGGGEFAGSGFGRDRFGSGYSSRSAGGSWDRDRDFDRGEGRGGGLSGMFRGKGPKGYQRSDDRIREDACECLTEDSMIDATNIEVTAKSGEVTLSGTVNTREEKRRAVDIIEDLSGVKEVHNNLRVASTLGSGMQGTQEAIGSQAGQTLPRH
jgi:osmotically-inducible protein OsmY